MPTWLGRLLEAAVGTNPVTSYTRLGFAVRSRGFDPRDLTAKTGRVALVTGANSGIGFATCRELAARGDRVWMLCRSVERGEEARARIGGDTRVARLDVGDLEDVRRFVNELPEPTVDVLVHSAAVLPPERVMTRSALEQTLATNLVGPYLLTTLLREKLERSADARLILVTSGGMFPRTLDVATLHHERGSFDGVTAYADSKRALVELGEHWAATIPKVTVSAMHPGWADTSGVKVSLPTFHRLTQWMLRSADEGADTVVWLALKDGLPSGKLWFDRAEISPFVFPWTRPPAGERERLLAALERWSK